MVAARRTDESPTSWEAVLRSDGQFRGLGRQHPGSEML